jgi:hypothetical protein
MLLFAMTIDPSDGPMFYMMKRWRAAKLRNSNGPKFLPIRLGCFFVVCDVGEGPSTRRKTVATLKDFSVERLYGGGPEGEIFL